MKKNKVSAIVLAAGQGKRMNSPVAKQFLKIKDKPILSYSLKAFQDSSVDEIVLVTSKDQMEYCEEQIIKNYGLNKVILVEGGKERYDSVYQALRNTQANYVLIHDGARPFLSIDLIEKIIMEVKNCKACIVGVPVKDTIKVVDDRGIIVATPARDTLWAAHTPQAFEYSAIRKAYDMLHIEEGACKKDITDDAMVYEKYIKKQVKMIYGDYHNLKLTTPEDLVFAEFLAEELLCEKNQKIEQFIDE